MANLLEVYDNMMKTAGEAEAEKQAEDRAVAVDQEKIKVLTKYAEAADSLLAEEYGDDYEEADVEKLAEMMIDYDLEQEEAMDKVAEYHQAGQIMARGFIAEVNAVDSK